MFSKYLDTFYLSSQTLADRVDIYFGDLSCSKNVGMCIAVVHTCTKCNQRLGRNFLSQNSNRGPPHSQPTLLHKHLTGHLIFYLFILLVRPVFHFYGIIAFLGLLAFYGSKSSAFKICEVFVISTSASLKIQNMITVHFHLSHRLNVPFRDPRAVTSTRLPGNRFA